MATKLRARILGTLLGPGVLALGLTALHLIAPSNINRNAWPWQFPAFVKEQGIFFMLAWHDQVGPLASRPLMSALIRALATLSGSLTVGYVGAILGSYWIAGLALQHAARRLAHDRGIATLVVFGASFTVLFAFFAPVYSHDDLLQYAFVFFALAWLDERPWRAGLLLCLAMIARETTVLLIPGLTLLLWFRPDTGTTVGRRKTLAVVAVVLLPAAFYLFYRRLLPFPDVADRFEHWRFNFESTNRAFESLLSPLLALLVVGAVASIAYRVQPESIRRYRPWLVAFAVTFAVNTPLVFVATRAREARLFALPLVFVWPIAGEWLVTANAAWRAARRELSWKKCVALPALVPTALVGAVVLALYHRTVAGSFYDGFRAYIIAVAYATAALHIAISSMPRRPAG